MIKKKDILELRKKIIESEKCLDIKKNQLEKMLNDYAIKHSKFRLTERVIFNGKKGIILDINAGFNPGRFDSAINDVFIYYYLNKIKKDGTISKVKSNYGWKIFEKELNKN